jgi:hypothetical protein
MEEDQRNTGSRWLRDIVLTVILIPSLMTWADMPPVDGVVGGIVALIVLRASEYRSEIASWIGERTTNQRRAIVFGFIALVIASAAGGAGGWYWIHRNPDQYTWNIPAGRSMILPALQLVKIPNPDALTLKDLFDIDFQGWFRTHDDTKISTSNNPDFGRVEFRLMMAPAIGTKTVGLYVPAGPTTFQICQSFVLHYLALMDAQKTLVLKMTLPGDSRQMTSQDLRFNGDVFLYTETPLSDGQKVALNSAFQKAGASEVSYRSGDWVMFDRNNLKAQQEKLSTSEPQKPETPKPSPPAKTPTSNHKQLTQGLQQQLVEWGAFQAHVLGAQSVSDFDERDKAMWPLVQKTGMWLCLNMGNLGLTKFEEFSVEAAIAPSADALSQKKAGAMMFTNRLMKNLRDMIAQTTWDPDGKPIPPPQGCEAKVGSPEDPPAKLFQPSANQK